MSETTEELDPIEAHSNAEARRIISKEMVMWYDDTLWVPFVEDENANITGPGWQSKKAFAEAVTQYDRRCTQDKDYEVTTPLDVSHQLVRIVGSAEDETLAVVPATRDTVGAVPVTTIWGVR